MKTFQKSLNLIKKNAMIFWGEYDSATSLSSGEKIHDLIENSSLTHTIVITIFH